jgi:hypothetical protein
MNAIAGAINNTVAGLVIKPGVVGTSAQVVLHLFAYVTGRQSGHRARVGISRAICLLTIRKKTRELKQRPKTMVARPTR